MQHKHTQSNADLTENVTGVTTMLNFFTTSNGFRSTLPVVSNLTAMNVWDGVCMCFIYASLLEFVCVNYMGRKRPQHNVVYRPGENPVTQVMYRIVEKFVNTTTLTRHKRTSDILHTNRLLDISLTTPAAIRRI